MTRILLATVLALTTAALGAPTAASGAIRIVKISYDSPGADSGSNRSLNAEWIRLKNTGNGAKSLRGWRVRDRAGHTYRFGKFRLRAGRTVTIHTGRGSNRARHRYWRQDWYVWNNDRDTVQPLSRQEENRKRGNERRERSNPPGRGSRCRAA